MFNKSKTNLIMLVLSFLLLSSGLIIKFLVPDQKIMKNSNQKSINSPPKSKKLENLIKTASAENATSSKIIIKHKEWKNPGVKKSQSITVGTNGIFFIKITACYTCKDFNKNIIITPELNVAGPSTSKTFTGTCKTLLSTPPKTGAIIQGYVVPDASSPNPISEFNKNGITRQGVYSSSFKADTPGKYTFEFRPTYDYTTAGSANVDFGPCNFSIIFFPESSLEYEKCSVPSENVF